MQSNPGIDPAAILPHYSMFDPEHEKIKWGVFEYARKQCPVAHSDAADTGGGHHVVTRYEDLRRILEDPATFSSADVTPQGSPVKLNPLDSDPPYQPELRKLLNPLFTRKVLLRYEPDLRKSANSLIDSFVSAGRFDFVRDYAAPYVGGALAKVVFNEDDPERMRQAADIVVQAGVGEDTEAALVALAQLAGHYITERQEHPVERDDVLNAITNGTVDGGRHLTMEEKFGVVTVLFLGGLDTTRGALGSIAYHLALEPHLEQRLRNPGWVRQDMDEFLRLESPVGCLARTATADAEVAGVSIKKGGRILLRFDSANRDEARFDNPDSLTFDVRRAGNVAFGLGIHRCLGAHFARIQIAVAFEELFKRLTNLRFAHAGEEVRWAPGIANGPESLVLAFDVVS